MRTHNWSTVFSSEMSAPGGITRPSASPLRGRPGGRSPPLRGVVEPELVLCRGFDPLMRTHNWSTVFSSEISAPGGITRPSASPLRGRPGGRSPPLRGVVEPELVLCRGFDPLMRTHNWSTVFSSEISAPGGIRTHDPRLRRPILYPAELQAQCRGGDTTRRWRAASSATGLMTFPERRSAILGRSPNCGS
jgi:hypothetical protein